MSYNNIIESFLFEREYGLITDSLETLYLVHALPTEKTILKILGHLPKTIYELDLSQNGGVKFSIVKYLNEHFTCLQTLSFENCENFSDGIEPLKSVGFEYLIRLELQRSISHEDLSILLSLDLV